MSFSNFGRGDEIDAWSRKIQNLMDEMARRSFVRFERGRTWQPATDVYETADAYYICVELAGMEPADVTVEFTEKACLCISGARGNPRPGPEVSDPLSVHVMEIEHGPFRREVQLPEPVEADAIEATYDKGYLWIKLPKRRA